MKTSELQRKARITWLEIRIVALRLAMQLEAGVSERWKAMARQQCRLVNERNNLRTADEIRKIEKRRGIQ